MQKDQYIVAYDKRDNNGALCRTWIVPTKIEGDIIDNDKEHCYKKRYPIFDKEDCLKWIDFNLAACEVSEVLICKLIDRVDISAKSLLK